MAPSMSAGLSWRRLVSRDSSCWLLREAMMTLWNWLRLVCWNWEKEFSRLLELGPFELKMDSPCKWANKHTDRHRHRHTHTHQNCDFSP